MNLTIKKILGASALLAVAGSALAAPVIPPGFSDNTGAALTSGYPLYNPETGTVDNGGLVFYLYGAGDATYSLTYYTGLKLDDLTPDLMDASGAGTSLQWHIPTSAIPSDYVGGFKWGVAAIDQGDTIGVDYGGNFERLATTVNTSLGGSDLNNTELDFMVQVLNSVDVYSDFEAAGALDTTTTAFANNDLANKVTNRLYTSGTTWVADPGSSLAFYYYTQSGNDIDATNFEQANKAVYAGLWSFDATTGTLEYSIAGDGGSPVPLPAAAWLLLSGLGGMGVFSRRRAAAKA